jgi:hypothetical protein
VFFYVNNYPDLVRRYPHAQFRTDNTPLLWVYVVDR